MQRKLGAVARQQKAARTVHSKVPAIEIRERGEKRAGFNMGEVCSMCDGGGDFFRRNEPIDVAASAREPAVEAIAECGSIGDGDVERAGGLHYASDFLEGAGEIVDVLQAVVGDNGVEDVTGEGKLRGVSLSEILGGGGWCV